LPGRIATAVQIHVHGFYKGAGVDLLVVRFPAVLGVSPAHLERIGSVTKIAQVGRRGSIVIPGLADVVSFPDAGLYVSVPVSVVGAETQVLRKRLETVDGRRVVENPTIAGRSWSASRSPIAAAKKVGDDIRNCQEKKYKIVGIFREFNVLQNGFARRSVAETATLMGARREGVRGSAVHHHRRWATRRY